MTDYTAKAREPKPEPVWILVIDGKPHAFWTDTEKRAPSFAPPKGRLVKYAPVAKGKK